MPPEFTEATLIFNDVSDCNVQCTNRTRILKMTAPTFLKHSHGVLTEFICAYCIILHIH